MNGTSAVGDRFDADAPLSLPLAAEFPSTSREAWLSMVAGVLRKSGAPATADPTAPLRWRTYDDIELLPLYSAHDAPAPSPPPGFAPFVRGASKGGGGWDLRQRHADPDPSRTRAAISADLAGGASSLWLRLGPGAVAVDDLEAVLHDVDLRAVPLALEAGAATPEVAARLLELAASRQTPTGSLRGSLGADPIAVQARGGAAADLALLQGFAAHVAGFPDLRLSTVDATVYHEAGGSDADELAVATSVGVAYLRAFTDAGLSIDAALAALEFRFAVTADQFGSIAKLRAARRMWDRVAELSGADPKRRGQRQHATTSTAMLTRRDPWVNLLRATIGCFAAAVAGADAITVYPYDGALGLPDDFSRRLARNTQAILAQESSLGRVLDAAGGSWYVEARTQALADRAWALFTSLERAGGALAALNSGFLDEQLSAAREARRADVAHRRAPITGVSEFALLTEEVLDRRCASATGSDDAAQGSVGSGVGSLSALRYAEPFEALRDRADAQLAATGARPRVVLATFGPVAAHSAAVGLAANLFAAGGIETVAVPDEAGDRDEVLALYGTTVVCLCPPDPSYAGPTFAAAEKWMAAGVTRLWLVGRPADWPDARDLGVAGHLSSGIDAIAVLGSTLDSLRVAA